MNSVVLRQPESIALIRVFALTHLIQVNKITPALVCSQSPTDWVSSAAELDSLSVWRPEVQSVSTGLILEGSEGASAP